MLVAICTSGQFRARCLRLCIRGYGNREAAAAPAAKAEVKAEAKPAMAKEDKAAAKAAKKEKAAAAKKAKMEAAAAKKAEAKK